LAAKKDIQNPYEAFRILLFGATSIEQE